VLSPRAARTEPEQHDYPAAYDYLTLITDDATATQLVDALKAAALTYRKAKDIMRASRLPLLDKDNAHVARDWIKLPTVSACRRCCWCVGRSGRVCGFKMI
jgi:hypothetical protein